MLQLIAFGIFVILMVASDRIWSNPLTIFGALFGCGCIWMCLAVVVKALTL